MVLRFWGVLEFALKGFRVWGTTGRRVCRVLRSASRLRI